MKQWLIKVAMTLALASAVPFASAVTVGAEYCQDDACGNAYIGNTKPDATGFRNWMAANGHSVKFLYGNLDFWPKDPVDSTVPGGLDWYYGDEPNVLYLSTHGASNTTRYYPTTGRTLNIDGLDTCRSYTQNPNTGKQWWKLGDKNLRILHLSTCEGLELTDLAHWDGVAKGLHLITGYDGTMADTPSAGSLMAFYGNLGYTVKQAHFLSRVSGDRAVIMAYGVTRDDAINRRDHEKYSWSMARLGPHTWRAWSWVD